MPALIFRAAQRMANNSAPVKTRVPEMPSIDRGGFCGALQRAPPAMPAGLARRLVNKENYGMGKVSETLDTRRGRQQKLLLPPIMYSFRYQRVAEKASRRSESVIMNAAPATIYFDNHMKLSSDCRTDQKQPDPNKKWKFHTQIGAWTETRYLK